MCTEMAEIGRVGLMMIAPRVAFFYCAQTCGLKSKALADGMLLAPPSCAEMPCTVELSMNIKSLLAVAAFTAFAAGSTAAKADLIVNGGFETGDTTGWTIHAQFTDAAP